MTPRLRDVAGDMALRLPEGKGEFFSGLRANFPAIQARYVGRVFDLVKEEDIKKRIEALGSKIEPLCMVDENDNPYLDAQGWWSTEFRKDYENAKTLPESKEHPLFCRIVLFILEDAKGNIIVTRRSKKKSTNPGELTMPGGHVIAGDSYLQTVVKELGEELKYDLQPGELTEDDRLFKYRNFTPGEGEYKGKGSIITFYRTRVSSMEELDYDQDEIEELKRFTPQELYAAIRDGQFKGEDLAFAPHHAYWYLEFLEQKHGIPTEEVRNKIFELGAMKNRTKLPIFGENE